MFQAQEPHASKKGPGSHLNAESLEQRINKVISENQAIVETLDPFWKGRYMRQSSREDTAASKERSRRYSQTGPGSQIQIIEEPLQLHHQQQNLVEANSRQLKPHSSSSNNSYREPSQNLATSLSANFVSNNVPPPPRPDSNIPLNLSDSGRKRKSPENPLIDAHSVKEVWLNSQKKTGNISQLEDIASKIEAKLRSSENPFHPDNPEGSIIKDLLLKTRAGQLHLVASAQKEADLSDREGVTVSKLSESPRHLPVNLQISPSSKGSSESDPSQNVVGIPIPKNFLPSHSKPSGSVETSLYQCNLCMVTFKSLESIEIHQSHYCKHTKHPAGVASLTPAPVSSSGLPARPQLQASPGELRRRAPEAGGEPPVKRSRVCEAGYPALVNGPANVTVTNTGLLQIAAPGPGHGMTVVLAGQSAVTTTTVSNIPGIPTPNLSGVLTGIKSQPLFSLPGVRAEHHKLAAAGGKTQQQQEEKPVTFVLGMPGPHSQGPPLHTLPVNVVTAGSSRATVTPPVTAGSSSRQPGHAAQLPPQLKLDSLVPVVTVSGVSVGAGALDHTFQRTVLGPAAPMTPVTLNCLPSPTALVTSGAVAGQRMVFNSPQRKYEFPASSKLEPHRPLDFTPVQDTLSSGSAAGKREQKPERPDSLALTPGALFKKKEVAISGSTLVSPETPRPKKAYVLSYQNGTAYTFLGLKCSTRMFFCSLHKAQPNYVQLEPNSRVSMYSNWKVVAKDSHPSGLSPRLGMAAYNSTNHCALYGSFSTAAPKKSLMITTHSSRWHEKKAACHSNIGGHGLDEKKSLTSTEVICRIKENSTFCLMILYEVM